MNDKLIKDFNKFQEIIKELYEKYDGEPFTNNEWNEFIKEGYNLFFPKPDKLVEDDEHKETIKNSGGWDCFKYATICEWFN